MPDKSDDMDYELVLHEIHGFMSALPQIWWNNRPSDTPIRFVIKRLMKNRFSEYFDPQDGEDYHP